MIKTKLQIQRGKVFLVGAGPGDADLITLKAVRCLRQAKVVFYDRLINRQLLNYAVDAELIDIGKKPGGHSVRQRDIEQLLIDHALEGKIVVRLKGGDPFIFGRGGEEAQALKRAQVPYEIIPGVSSAIAAPAYAGIPVTHRDYASSLAIVTGHRVGKIRWRELLSAVDTIVIVMGLHHLGEIMSSLLQGGCHPLKPVALIESGTYTTQRTLKGTVAEIAALAQQWKFRAPTIIVLGEVVRLGQELQWFHPRKCVRSKGYVRRNNIGNSDTHR